MQDWGGKLPMHLPDRLASYSVNISMKLTVPDGTSEVGGSGRRAARTECLCQGWRGGRQMCTRVDSGMRCVRKRDAVQSAQSCLTLCDPMDCSPLGSSVRGIGHGKNTGVDYHFLLQGIFLIQGSNPHLLHCCGFFTAELLSPAVQRVRPQIQRRGQESQATWTLCVHSHPHSGPAEGRHQEDRSHHIRTRMAWLLMAPFSLSCPGVSHHRSPLDVAWCLINGITDLIKLIFLPSSAS